MTLAAHAKSGESIYVKSVRRHAMVFFVANQYENRGMHAYELEFVEAPNEGRFPILYDVVHQGHIIMNDLIDESLFEEDESFTGRY